MIRRRYSRRYASLRKIALSIILVAALAVATGYVATEYIIKPYILGIKTETPLKDDSLSQEGSSFTGSSIIADKQNPIVNPTGDENNNSQQTQGQEGEEKEAEDVNSGTNEKGQVLYTIQYGSFSDLSGAEKTAASLAASEISVAILEKNGAFKLVGQPFLTKDEAKASLAEIRETVGDEPFVAEVEVRMK